MVAIAASVALPPFPNGCSPTPTPGCCSYTPSSPVYVALATGGAFLNLSYLAAERVIPGYGGGMSEHATTPAQVTGRFAYGWLRVERYEETVADRFGGSGA